MRKNFNVSLFTIHLLYVQALTYGERLPYAYTNRVGKQSKKWESIEKTLESSLDSKEIKPVNPKGKQPRILIARTLAEAETPILWPPDAKSQLTGKDLGALKYWRQKEKGVTEDKMLGWHQWLNGHEFEQSLRDSGGQRRLVCYCLRSRKESDMI